MINSISAQASMVDLANLPQFSQISTNSIVESVQTAIAKCKDTVEQAVSDGEISYENLVSKLEQADDELSQLWSPIGHMNSVVSNDDLRAAHDACLPLLSEYSTYLGQHEKLCALYQALQKSPAYDALSMAQKKVVDNAVRDFTLSGVALPQEKKTRFAAIRSELSDLSSQFSNNVMDATLDFTKHVTDEAQLSGLPDSAKAAARQAAEQKSLEGYLFTLDIPSYLPIAMYADDRKLREEMYRAYSTRASELDSTEGKFDNTDNIKKTLQLRYEMAQLLGFDSYAQYSLATKMAESPEQVTGFLRDLAKRSKPQAQQDVEELRAFALQEYGVSTLEAWDYSYYSEKLKQQKYAVSDEQLRPYFPEDKVLSGLFEVVTRLYSLNIVEVTGVDTWHKDVRFFEIRDEAGELRGSFYLDLYAREKKRGGAWMDECRVKRTNLNGEVQSPVAFLTCNFNAPVGDKPALFTHDEVVTLFHEFGHGIHHMLTKVTVGGVSGINGVPWDAVELPSQFLENWCWEPQALAFISGHFETGEPLPQDLLDKMLAARNFQSAMQMVRQLEFSLFDFELHRLPSDQADVQKVLNEVRDEVSVIKPPLFNRFQNSFGHIFAGGYAAGYYSYKWAEVLSSDAFSRFEEEGIFNSHVGQSFLQNVLEQGGSQEPMALFVAFRGREPNIDALLRHSGINPDAQAA
ncbi:oligopeptidase A [Glaciecola sp. XM2]|uniref:oligopeptidase A n=1 Tax=Glaciecola sp. XM2 TaxID=1914931 RepID=UPI001BDDE59C|nr:oligopeptidase A [Glaciecola sp. XM2]MBT1452208.1 oligopeptidase A [Glaciecola sp. XM2]